MLVNDLNSLRYLAKQADIEAEAERKRAKKAEEIRAAMEYDPFAADEPTSNSAGVPGIPTENQLDRLEPSVL